MAFPILKKCVLVFGELFQFGEESFACSGGHYCDD